MKGFVAGLIAGVAVGGGTLIAAGLPNPDVGECEFADIVVTRGNPTYINPEGEITGLHGWQVCGYQVPTGEGSDVRAIDEQFYFEVDVDDAELLVSAAEELLDR